ncbi:MULTISPECIES: helix-turn-helix transcriptional regulator [Enterobacter]|uniref:Transcriptional regulator n=1 Tax=Enterobacter cloacae TaxID=550 RepID=A0A7H8UJQ5_ENTCL|nr:MULTISPECIES: helix-turn-helix transcriptional regulator [Enterobacter]MCM7514549.1 helix-turn-helix transcriptional regulator [Enterobacter hormaechei]MCI2294111.1 helix-turn-helix transcriptional regulator [Enterobacter sp. I4]MCY0771856.1 helix-turn-helix transcriptional regulator [Enterobacter cloacae complex sp. 2022EL-00788]MDE4081342.1 helix-turn-helix transcriptional regulator [Enterobacter pasteurii]QLA00089.1 transcriptional regulator [Enterobacter cloacae]
MKSDYAKQIELISGPLEAAMEALAGTLSANQEIVLHNLTTPDRSVIKIVNGHVSGRKAGDNLLSGPEKDKGFALLLKKSEDSTPVTVKNYKTVTASGRTLNSASTIYYSEEGVPLMAFCINIDTSPYDQMRKCLDAITGGPLPDSDPQDMNLGGIIEQSIQEIIDKHSVPGKKVQKAQRLKIVAEMHAKGIFKMRGGVQHAAQALGVTRYTVYNDLEVMGEK